MWTLNGDTQLSAFSTVRVAWVVAQRVERLPTRFGSQLGIKLGMAMQDGNPQNSGWNREGQGEFKATMG